MVAIATKVKRMTEPWIRGCVVQRIMFRDGLVLSLDDNELVIAVPFHLTLPSTERDAEEAVFIDPKTLRVVERALFDFAGSTCTHASWDEDGSLHLRFSDGHEIHAHSDQNRTAWELYGKHHGYATCLAHGRVRVVRHDLPEDESAER
jgi:Family of unknown function (DUF6188)